MNNSKLSRSPSFDEVPDVDYRTPVFVPNEPRPIQRLFVHPSIPSSAFMRLARSADYGNFAESKFTLTRVPHETQWLTDGDVRPLASLGVPLTLRVVGSLLNFGVQIGNADAHMFFEIDPLRAIDHEGMLRLFDMAFPPPGTGFVAASPDMSSHAL
ncbi:hypothetical protein TRAPUB_9573 [Trametes pubescens]|uniref:Uncharacterized protein n=1 Tax=Trametes pubescens TaxID=154538 RepID=A0A1M2W226_TRAPU|nr:hypothetical protein TRAPUB_9573 [Trametes pubescens]